MKDLNNNFQKDLGLRIKELREKNNLTQNELSEITGLTSRQISGIETGQQEMSISNAHKIAVALNTTLCFMIRGIKAL